MSEKLPGAIHEGGFSCFVALPLVWVFAATAKRREGLRGFLAELPAWALQAVTFLIVLTFCLAVPAATLSGGHPLEQDEIQVTCSSVELLARMER